MSLLKSLGGAGASASAKLYPEDVFSTYLYEANLISGVTVNNGIDLLNKGGMIQFKCRNFAAEHGVFDSSRTSFQKGLRTNTTIQQLNFGTHITPTSNGFILDNAGYPETNNNNTGAKQVSWTFRKAPKFFDIVTYTGNGVAGRQIPHNLGCEVGMIIVKRTDVTGYYWKVYHRSINATMQINLNTTDAADAYSGNWNNTEPTSTYFTLGGGYSTNSPEVGATYVAYLYAHDTSADGIIQCGSFTTDGSGNATVTLGWEPQYVMAKQASGIGAWEVVDTMRGQTAGPSSSASSLSLYPNNSNTESQQAPNCVMLNSTGFSVNSYRAFNATFIYMAIRRPMKVPTSGTEVYNAIAYIGATDTKRTVGFPADSSWTMWRTVGNYCTINDRLRGYPWDSNPQPSLQTQNTAAEQSYGTIHSVDNISAKDGTNTNTFSVCTHHFKRAKGFFDVVCYTGTGVARTVNHNLGVVPELMIVKLRNSSGGDWCVYAASQGAPKYAYLNQQQSFGVYNFWNYTTPTSSVFTVGNNGTVNGSTYTYVAYLFATLAGISKVGSYTGNGSSINLDMGFSTGCRFFLCKRTDSTGDWMVADTVRGITAGADNRLSLNTTAVEVTTDDWCDSYAQGLTVNQTAASNANVLNATYIYLGIS